MGPLERAACANGELQRAASNTPAAEERLVTLRKLPNRCRICNFSSYRRMVGVDTYLVFVQNDFALRSNYPRYALDLSNEAQAFWGKHATPEVLECYRPRLSSQVNFGSCSTLR
jgi:hypothetical protein